MGSYFNGYYLTDHLGSTRAVVDDGGTVLETFDYYPFGLLMPKRSSTTGNTIEKFTGKERDTEGNLNLDYFGARYYDPALGRWQGVDPLADKYPGLNPYNFVMNNPLLLVDPDGMDIDLSSLYKRENGELVNPHAVEAFERWASTEEGAAYLGLFAQAGFTLEGEIVKELNLSFDTEGILSKNGVDYNAVVTDISSYEPYSSKWGGDPSGFVHSKISGDRLQVNMVFDHKDEGWPTTPANRMHSVDTWAHESMYHGYAEAIQYLASGGNYKRLSNIHSNNLFDASPYGSYSDHKLVKYMGLDNKKGIPAVNIILQAQLQAGLPVDPKVAKSIIRAGWPRSNVIK